MLSILPFPRRGSRASLLLAGSIALTSGLLLLPVRSANAQIVQTLISTGLNNARGVAIGPNGAIYIAESGLGGNGPTITGGTGPISYGATGSVMRYQNGAASRVLTGVASLAPAGGDGSEAVGLSDIVFVGNTAYGIIGLGADPALRSTFTEVNAPGSSFLGHLVQLSLDNSNVLTDVADVAAFERTNNPGGETTPPPTSAPIYDSNPYSLISTPNGFAVADAGANAVLQVTPGGTVSLITALAPKANPLPFGPPTYQAVPTSLALTGTTLYIGELTGFPFPAGGANLYTAPLSGGAATAQFGPGTARPGFTNIIDIALNGNYLYVLQYTSTGIAGPPSAGQLQRIDLNSGFRETILTSPLLNPGGMAVASNSLVYITNRGNTPGSGQLLAVTIAPEPGSIALLASGLAGAGLLPVIRRRRRTL